MFCSFRYIHHFHYRNVDVSTVKELTARWKPDVLTGFKKKGVQLFRQFRYEGAIEAFDEALEINFEDFVVGETHTLETREKMVKDSVKTGEITLDSGRKKDVIGTVSADVVLYRMDMSSRGVVNLSITKNGMESKDLAYQDFPGEFVWYHHWGTYNGDNRALTAEQLEICNRRPVNPPPPQQLFVEFTKIQTLHGYHSRC